MSCTLWLSACPMYNRSKQSNDGSKNATAAERYAPVVGEAKWSSAREWIRFGFVVTLNPRLQILFILVVVCFRLCCIPRGAYCVMVSQIGNKEGSTKNKKRKVGCYQEKERSMEGCCIPVGCTCVHADVQHRAAYTKAAACNCKCLTCRVLPLWLHHTA